MNKIDFVVVDVVASEFFHAVLSTRNILRGNKAFRFYLTTENCTLTFRCTNDLADLADSGCHGEFVLFLESCCYFLGLQSKRAQCKQNYYYVNDEYYKFWSRLCDSTRYAYMLCVHEIEQQQHNEGNHVIWLKTP